MTVTVPTRERIEGSVNNTQNEPVCVETDWLVNHRHEEEDGHRFRKSLTYCIKGLPFGTPGHLLRRYDVDGKGCRLVSFSELCNELDARCVTKLVEVSRLRHGMTGHRSCKAR